MDGCNPEMKALERAVKNLAATFDMIPVHWALIVGGMDGQDIDSAIMVIVTPDGTPGYVADGLLYDALHRSDNEEPT